MLLRRYHEKEQEDKALEDDLRVDNDTDRVKGCNDITKADIVEQLDQKGIEHNPRDTKQELYDLLLGSD